MTPRTLRRKLQKKKKRKPYRKCPARGCGRRATCRVYDDGGGWQLLRQCGCGRVGVLVWSGRVVERQTHTPRGSGPGRGKA